MKNKEIVHIDIRNPKSWLERFGYTTLIECKLETGRTHQIRAHFKHIGHPLFNDEEDNFIFQALKIKFISLITKAHQFGEFIYSLQNIITSLVQSHTYF